MIADWSPDRLLAWRGSASVAWLVLLLAWETAAPARPWFATGWERGRHGVLNVLLALINGVLIAAGFTFLWRHTADWAAVQSFGLLHAVALPGWARLPAAILLLDLWTYAWHRACHRVPLLWRFHQVHHCDSRMDVTTGNRFHAGEIVLSAVLRLPLILLLGLRFGDLVLYETMLQAVVQWQHANITLPPALERLLRQFLVTPGLHQVHHSREPVETDSNYASLCPVWDRIFRSLRLRADSVSVPIGLDGVDAASQQSLRGLLGLPFRRS